MKIIRIMLIAVFLVSGLIFNANALAQGPCGEIYVVLPGDTLSDIAELCQVTVTDLLAANPEITDPTQLFVGMRLRIPIPEEDREPVIAITPVCGPPGTRVSLVASGFPPGVFVDLGVARPDSEYFVAGRVRADSFGKIVTEVTIPSVAMPNRIYVIQADTSLNNQDISASSTEFSVTPGAEDPRQQLQYFIQSGDTLVEIATKFGRRTQDILEVNPGLSDPNQFQEGRQVIIPAVETDDPRLTLNPTCGSPGSVVQVSGDRLLANRNIYLNLNKWFAAPQQASAGRTDSQGSFRATLEIPHAARLGEFWVVTAETAENPQSRGISNLFAVAWPPDPNAPRIYTINPEDTLNEIAERFGRTVRAIVAANPDIENMNQILVGTRLIIPSPTETVTVTPTRGPAGSQIQIRGNGFPPEAKVEVGLGRSANSYEVYETVITDEQGEFTSQTTIPSIALPRQRWVVVAILARAGVTEVTAVSDPFSIVQAEQSSNETLITIWPVSGPPGSELLVSAAGFPPTMPIQVGIARQGEEPQEFVDSWTDLNGTFAMDFTIPNEAHLGESWVVIAQTTAAPILTSTSEAFIVTSSQGFFINWSTDLTGNSTGRISESMIQR